MRNDLIAVTAAALLLIAIFSAVYRSNSGTGNVIAGEANVVMEPRGIYDATIIAAAALIIVIWRYNMIVEGHAIIFGNGPRGGKK